MLGSILVALLAGWLAGQMVRGHGFGIILDTILGTAGGILAVWLFHLHAHHFIGSLLVATVGATAIALSARILFHDSSHRSRIDYGLDRY